MPGLWNYYSKKKSRLYNDNDITGNVSTRTIQYYY